MINEHPLEVRAHNGLLRNDPLSPLAVRTLMFALFLIGSVVLFKAPVKDLVTLSLHEDQYSHLILIPLISLTLLYLERGKIFTRLRFSLGAGSLLLLAGLAFNALGLMYSSRLSPENYLFIRIFALFMIWVAGFTVCYGAPAARAALFPLLFAFLMVPLPSFVMDKPIIFIQYASTEVASLFFRLAGMAVFRDGLRFSLPGIEIEIARQCSGIHSLVALFIFSLLVGHYYLQSAGRRIFLSLFVFPIISLTNGFRIFTISLLSVLTERNFFASDLHKHGGVIFFALGLVLLTLVSRWLRHRERHEQPHNEIDKTNRSSGDRAADSRRIITAAKENLAPSNELTYWERIGLSTRWGRYSTEIQRNIIISAMKMGFGSGTALEIGADGGRWSTVLLNQGWAVTCTDVRPDALDLCQRRLPQANCILVKPTDKTLPCATNTINLLLCMEVDSVISSAWFFDEALRVLTSGGVFVATINNRSSLRAVFHEVFKQGDANIRKEGGFYQVSYRDCRRRILQSGFKLIHEEGFCWPPFTRESNSFLIPFFVGLEKYLGLRRLTSLSPWVVFAARKD